MDGLGLVQVYCWFSMTLAHAFFIVFVCDAHIFGLPKKKTNCTVCKSYHSLEKRRKYGKDGLATLTIMIR